MEFHVSRDLRDKLDLDGLLFSYTGNVIFGNVAGSRKLAKQLNEIRGTGSEPGKMVNAGALFAMGLIDELSHAMVSQYRKDIDPAVLSEAVRWFSAQAGPAEVERLLLAFTEQFPNTAIYQGKVTASEWLKGTTEEMPNREAALEELLLLWLANANPAFSPFGELFGDANLRRQTVYGSVTSSFPDYFTTRPPVAPEVGSLFDALRAPMLASPDSLTGQLDFIREHWAKYVGEDLRRVLLAIDVLREEDLAIWMRFHPPSPDRHRHGEPGREAQGFVGDEFVGFDDDFVAGADGVRRRRRYSADHQAPLNEYEAFSPDQAWMPNVVLMAKSTYVWLEQLSKKYGRHIHRLDQIPDEELKLLAERGMTALWLIGLWERSTASQTIKRMRGHSDAVASAYSLKEYQIAQDLGGTSAYENLRDRAGRFGLRLASDMVPNHMGIDSTWVIEHPDWFISRGESPFPVYTFEGPDLSNDSRVEIKIEDHYFDQTDAAVAFRLRHHRDGTTRYVYHGNDGTTFAWNDTAQLDYSKALVREMVIQTIFHVARLFPIIRFDAAMTLAKRHVQRLWFPLPGVGGSIPSRAESAMSQEEFDALMPHEFWREVVDRVAAEVPGTLLLAEAFWLLEGYFVRTLGMHRVYNSAFMNMLRDEENAKYRSYLKKTIEFDPDILKRYVNFMSNPDERTAIDQFGTGDKYFGTSTLLATLPGLPMFGHGQVEAFTERYGMEFKQARMDETPNEGLMARHQHEIAPLLKNRYLFADSTNFVLYDFWTGHGNVDENVFAYSNRSGDQRAVVLYNNSYGSTRGTIHISAASVDKRSGSLVQKSLTDGLAVSTEHNVILGYRDANHHLEFLRRAGDLQHHGLTLDLRGYQYVVLQNWRELRSSAEHPWDRLCDALNGGGVPSLDDALLKLRLRPLHEALRETISRSTIQAFAETAQALLKKEGRLEGKISSSERRKGEANLEDSSPEGVEAPTSAAVSSLGQTSTASTSEEAGAHPELQHFLEKSQRFFQTVNDSLGWESKALLEEVSPPTLEGLESRGSAPAVELTERYRMQCAALMGSAIRLPLAERDFSTIWPAAVSEVLPANQRGPAQNVWAPVLAWIVLRSMPRAGTRTTLFDRLQLRSALAEILSWLGMEGEDAWRAAARVRVLLSQSGVAPATALQAKDFWDDPDVRWLAGMSEAYGSPFLNKERFEELLTWLQLPGLLEAAKKAPAGDGGLTAIEDCVGRALRTAEDAGYNLDKFLLVWQEGRGSKAPSAEGARTSDAGQTVLPDVTHNK